MAQRPERLSRLDQLERELEDCSRRAAAVCAGLPRELMAQAPRPDAWCVADCLAHLAATTNAFLPRLAKLIDDARAQGRLGAGPYRMDVVGRLMRWSFEPPPRLRFRAPARFQPQATDPGQALAGFEASQEGLRAAIRRADGIALDRLKVRSAVSRRIRYNLFSAFAIMAAHQRRHLWQAEQARARVLETGGGPGG